MAGAPTPNPLTPAQLQVISGVIRQRIAELGRFPAAEYTRHVRLAKTVPVGGVYPESGNTFGIRFIDAGFTPLAAGSTTVSATERTVEGDDEAPDVIAREINGLYVPEGFRVAALWQRGAEGDPDDYGEWWIRWPTGPDPRVCSCASSVGDAATCCGAFDPISTMWMLRVPKMINVGCTHCSVWEGDFELCLVGFDRWESPPYAGTECGHSAGDPLWKLELVGTSAGYHFQLEAVGLGYRWTQSCAAWQCRKRNALSLSYPLPSPQPCDLVPDTLTLFSCLECHHWCATGIESPESVQIEFNDVLDGACGCATELDSAFIVDSVAAFGNEPMNAICEWLDTTLGNVPACGGFTTWCTTRLRARVQDLGGADGVSWVVRLERTCFPYVATPVFAIEWKWASGGTADIDCSLPRTLTLDSVSDPDAVCDWTGSTVTLTPL